MPPDEYSAQAPAAPLSKAPLPCLGEPGETKGDSGASPDEELLSASSKEILLSSSGSASSIAMAPKDAEEFIMQIKREREKNSVIGETLANLKEDNDVLQQNLAKAQNQAEDLKSELAQLQFTLQQQNDAGLEKEDAL